MISRSTLALVGALLVSHLVTTATAQEPADDGAEPADGATEAPTTCTYRTYSWSVEERRGVNRQTVEKPYSEVTSDERDPNDPRCSVCVEDQGEIDPAALGLSDVEPFLVCRVHQQAVEAALRDITTSGQFELVEITGYRVGRTRGPVVDGLRTEWSNHSFGTAIDINAGDNGLYGGCNVVEVTPESIDQCRLRVGGAWDPNESPQRSVTRDGPVYRAFTEQVGWRWGGEIDGDTRDLMHFSITGY